MNDIVISVSLWSFKIQYLYNIYNKIVVVNYNLKKFKIKIIIIDYDFKLKVIVVNNYDFIILIF